MFTSDFPVTSSKNIHNSVAPSTHNTWTQQPPEYMPWGHLPQQRVTRFSGEPDEQSCSVQEPLTFWNAHHDIWKSVACPSPVKRKIEDPIEGQVRKQLITEDKITVHMSQLHIGATPPEEQSRLDPMEDDAGSTSLDGIKIDAKSKLVLSEEIRHFQQENSIPPSLLENFTKPSMAVVLWQPRNTVHQLLRDMGASTSSPRPNTERIHENPNDDVEIAEDDSNNNEPISNYNLNEVVGQQQPDLEMDDDL